VEEGGKEERRVGGGEGWRIEKMKEGRSRGDKG
jgi:hypothetical protein